MPPSDLSHLGAWSNGSEYEQQLVAQQYQQQQQQHQSSQSPQVCGYCQQAGFYTACEPSIHERYWKFTHAYDSSAVQTSHDGGTTQYGYFSNRGAATTVASTIGTEASYSFSSKTTETGATDISNVSSLGFGAIEAGHMHGGAPGIPGIGSGEDHNWNPNQNFSNGHQPPPESTYLTSAWNGSTSSSS